MPPVLSLRAAMRSNWKRTKLMCGITGIIDLQRNTGPDVLAREVAAMSERLQHRGPDGSDVFVDPDKGVAFGFRRLAIQDLSPAGMQPMSSPSGRYICVYNGEIYNFRQLKQDLESRGVTEWRGTSDTEVMLALVEHDGVEAALEKLDGMFAIALFDREKRLVYLIRDRMGEKPLFYGWSGNQFVFGSELKALTASPAWRGDINQEAVDAYMRYAYIPAPYTVYQGVKKLLPGHIVTLNLDTAIAGVLPAASAYWNAKSEVETAASERFDGSEEEIADELEKLLTQSVSRRLISDVPLGVFLSGGIDSSTVTAVAQNVSSHPIKTFTIAFDNSRFDESGSAAKIAEHLGTEHVELWASADAPIQLVERMPEVYDEPFADVSQLPTLLLSELTRKHVTVALSGDGGDELFIGYPRYLAAESKWKAKGGVLACTASWAGMLTEILPPRAINRMTIGPRPWRFGDKLYRYTMDANAATPESVYEAFVSRWRTAIQPCGEPVIGFFRQPFGYAKLADPVERMTYADTVSYLPDDLLVKIDRATMAVSLEGRAPLLDHAIVRFAWRLPRMMRESGSLSKRPLRAVLGRYVPEELFDRPKQGFEPPLGDWLRGPLRAWAESLLSQKSLGETSYFDPVPVQAIWKEHKAGVRDWRFELWNVLMFQAWRQAWRV
ncbi:MAG: asparagine synthase (glutamine-hydrolyzing) [Rickettsiales bacterium]|nr:asparagine synthase (glutamine-hydrolyzing) [Rickettsiales bacterium]